MSYQKDALLVCHRLSWIFINIKCQVISILSYLALIFCTRPFCNFVVILKLDQLERNFFGTHYYIFIYQYTSQSEKLRLLQLYINLPVNVIVRQTTTSSRGDNQGNIFSTLCWWTNSQIRFDRMSFSVHILHVYIIIMSTCIYTYIYIYIYIYAERKKESRGVLRNSI